MHGRNAFDIKADVLIIGSGPAGSTAAALLSSYGISNIVVNNYNWLANTPRAHITNQRSLEIFRDLGIEHEVKALAVQQEWMGNNVFCTSLAGEEIGRLKSWGTHPLRLADYTLASPTSICDIPQTLLEPIIMAKAARGGSQYRFNTEYLSHAQDAEGVTATVLDKTSGATYQIRAAYMIGADGANSRVAKNLNLPFEGKMGIGGNINIVCNMDLSQYVAHRPSTLYWVLQPGSNIGGIGMGLVRMVRPWHKWLIVWGYDIAQEAPKVTDEMAKQIVRNLIGNPDLDVEIESASAWTTNQCYATTLYDGRVFCAGDAVHRHPPSNGLGSNTSVQDAFNLCWKLALVLKGKAHSALLHTYQEERAPVAKQIVNRANKSITDTAPIFDALGLNESFDTGQMQQNMERRKEASAEAEEQREKLRQAIAYKSYEFNCHGVELNQRYKSEAVIADETPEPVYIRDEELYYQATSRPGAHLPHVWIGKNGHQLSVLDVCGKGKFTLLTGIGGEQWMHEAIQVAEKAGMPITIVQIGAGRIYTDIYGDWAKAREIRDSGCLLVRPDFHIAFRAQSSDEYSPGILENALLAILGWK